MHQGSSVSSSNAEMQGLHPILHVALDSLDVELEEELTRYRRQRYRQARLGGHQSTLSWKPPTERARATGQSLDLPSFNASVRQPPESQTGSSPIDRAPTPPQSPLLSAAMPSVKKGQAASQLNSASGILEFVDHLQPVPPSIALGQSAGDAALATIDPDQLPNPGSNPANQANLARSNADEAPEDYLESTEELLRSIAEESPNLRAERESNLLDSLLTPLGIGSMLLLLLSSVTLGYVIMHPSSLDLLTAQDAADGTKINSTEQSSTEQSSETTGATSIPNTPNLAADEFVDLSLDTLSTVPRNGAHSAGSQATASGSNPTAANSSTSGKTNGNPDSIANSGGSGVPSGVSLPADPVAAAPAAPSYIEPAYTEPAYTEPAYTEPTPEASSETSPAATVPSTSETAPQVATAPSSSTSSGNYYYVVTPYSGDPSLEQAREAVPDAYVRNFSSGANVQLGAFSDPTKAEDLLQQLQEQGISAEIYQPQ